MKNLTQSFLLEHQALDKDHEQLLVLANEIIAGLDENCVDKCEEQVSAFIESSKAHFAREEAVLIKAGYPNARKHQDHHKKLTAKMDHLLEFARMVGENLMARESLRKELTFFLMDDVITTDLEFKAFLEDSANHQED